MVKKCCVPGCNSNYNNTDVYISTFKFPREESRRQLWIKKINRENFIPSPTAVVCIKHFSDQFIIRENRAVRDDGSVLIVPRSIPKLSDDAYPSIFPNQPIYLSSEPTPKRKNPSERHREIAERDEQNFEQWCSNDIISSFDDFRNTYKEKIGKEWISKEENDFILFYKIEYAENPKILVSFKVLNDLTIRVWYGQHQLDSKQFEFILQKNKCDRWTKLDCLFNLLGSYDENKISQSDKFKYVTQILLDYKREIENEEEDKCLQTSSYLNVDLPAEGLHKDFSELLSTGLYHDVELKCEEKFFKAHKIVLCARSSVFKAMLESDMKERRTGIVAINDVDVRYFQDFVRYLYTDSMPELTLDEATVLYEAGDKYGITSLMLRCSEYFQDNLSPENAFQCLALADAHLDQKLKDKIISYISDQKLYHLDKYWSPFCKSYPKIAVEVYRLLHKRNFKDL